MKQPDRKNVYELSEKRAFLRRPVGVPVIGVIVLLAFIVIYFYGVNSFGPRSSRETSEQVENLPGDANSTAEKSRN